MAATITTLSKYYQAGIEYGFLKVAIPTADCLTLNSVPITILTAPGAGKSVMLNGIPSYSLTFAAAAFATNTTLNLLIDTATLGTNQLYEVDISQAASTIIDMTKVAVAVGPQYIANKALVLQLETGDATGGGTSSITMYVPYKVITL